MSLYRVKWFFINLNIFKHTFHSIEGFVYVDKNKKTCKLYHGQSEMAWNC